MLDIWWTLVGQITILILFVGFCWVITIAGIMLELAKRHRNNLWPFTSQARYEDEDNPVFKDTGWGRTLWKYKDIYLESKQNDSGK
tara:strand:+ start:293 stop:550 length:258 start_codon:yes stop_codon:yes gene_type:complete